MDGIGSASSGKGLHSDLRRVLQDSLRMESERSPAEFETSAPIEDLRDQTWQIFQRYIERTGQPPDFEILAAHPVFKGLGEKDKSGVLRRTFLDLHEIWRRTGGLTNPGPSSGEKSKDSLAEPVMRRAAVTKRVNDYLQFQFRVLEVDFGRDEAKRFSTAAEASSPLSRFYQLQSDGGIAVETLDKAATEAIDAMKEIHERLAMARKGASSGIDTSKWKSDQVKREREELRKAVAAELAKTIHHKLPRQLEGKLTELMTREQRAKLESRLAISGRRELLSLGSNLLLGPKERADEPGEKVKGIAAFDGTPTESGKLTPRSAVLEQAYEILHEMVASNRTELLNEDEFEEICGLLETAEKLHHAESQGKVLDSPEGKWELDKASGRHRKAPQKDSDRSVPLEPVSALKRRAAMATAPLWLNQEVPKSSGVDHEAIRKRCAQVWKQLHAVRIRLATLDTGESIDGEAAQRMEAMQMFPYGMQDKEWAEKAEAWAKENEAWAQKTLMGLEKM